jgi:hypothetical protein
MSDRSDTDETRRIDVPEPLAEKLERRAAESSFDSLDDYATFALELLIRELDETDGEGNASSEAAPEARNGKDSDTTAENGAESPSEVTEFVSEGDPTADAPEDEAGEERLADEAVRDRLDSLGYL